MSGNSAPGFEKYPTYTVGIEPEPRRLSVRVSDTVVADTHSALAVTESKHHPVWYLPFSDVDQSLLSRSQTETYCPFKGTASYWHVDTPSGRIEDALWAYEAPYDECEALVGYVSFYANKVAIQVDGDDALAQPPGFTE